MDCEKVLAELRAERNLIDKAIANIEFLARSAKRGPGRPLGSVTKSKPTEKTKSVSRP